MAVALGSHITFWDDLTTLTDAEIATAREWVDLYRTWRDRLATFTYPLLDDPAGGTNWTALQPWDRDADHGMVLVYRQDAPEASSATSRCAASVPAAATCRDVRIGPRARHVHDRAQLTGEGLPVHLAERFSAAVLSVDPV